jgi:AhpD family alkylhydroperoxidase
MTNIKDREKADMVNDQNRNKSEADDKILDQISQEMGRVPTPLKLMAMRPGTVKAFMDYRNQIVEGGPLSEKEQALVAIATSVALKSAPCIRTHSNRARKFGVNEDEIVQTILIASYMSGSSPLHAVTLDE